MRKLLFIGLIVFGFTNLSAEMLYNDSYITRMKKIDKMVDTGINTTLKASTLRSPTIRNIMRFEPLFFNGHNMTETSKQTLSDIKSLISSKHNHSYYISVLGHTSSNLVPSHDIDRSVWSEFWQKAGGEDMSQEESINLANSRIHTVYDALRSEGIRKNNIYTENRMDADLIATEESRKGIAMNNRVDIALYLKGNINLHIKFKLDSSIITSYYDKRVKAFARFLRNNRDYKAWIIGHTDEQAGYEYNIALSKRRANATKRLLVSLGVYESQLRTKGKGEMHPLDRRSNKIAYRKNRRIEAQLIEP